LEVGEDVCGRHAMPSATSRIRKANCSGMDVSDVKRLQKLAAHYSKLELYQIDSMMRNE
jgi:hypothetical protein